MTKILVPLKELPQYASNVRAALALDHGKPRERATVVLISGALGAGKTTFVQEVARQFGIEEPVLSPTYVLMKKYKLPSGLNPFGKPRWFKTFIHIDAYRLEKPQEFLALKPEEFLSDPHALVLIEWPEKLGKLLPKPDYAVTFSDGASGGERYIEVT